MPLYEYACQECDHHFEILQRMDEGGDGLACPDCGAEEVEKQLSVFAAGGASASNGTAQSMPTACCRGTAT